MQMSVFSKVCVVVDLTYSIFLTLVSCAEISNAEQARTDGTGAHQ